MDTARLTRSETDRMVAGVAGGLAEFFDIDPTVVRLLFVLLTMVGGGGVLAYLAMWMLVPPASRVDAPSGEVMRDNVAEGRAFAEDAARRVRGEIDRLRGSQPERPSPPPSAPPPPPSGQPGPAQADADRPSTSRPGPPLP